MNRETNVANSLFFLQQVEAFNSLLPQEDPTSAAASENHKRLNPKWGTKQSKAKQSKAKLSKARQTQTFQSPAIIFFPSGFVEQKLHSEQCTGLFFTDDFDDDNDVDDADDFDNDNNNDNDVDVADDDDECSAAES